MNKHKTTQKMPLRLLISGIGAAILLLATVFGGIYLGTQTQQRFNDVEISWQAYSIEAERRGKLLSRIRVLLGYGGIIHNFKNYVLRQHDDYLNVLTIQFDDFNSIIEQYRLNNLSQLEQQNLTIIEKTIVNYQSKLSLAQLAAKENWSAERTDRLVKVDDSGALEALLALEQYWYDRQEITTNAITEAVHEGNQLVRVGFRFMAGLVIVTLTLLLLFYLLQSELRQTIKLLSKELNERKAAQQIAKKFHRAVEQSPATIIITNIKREIEYVNKKFSELSQYSSSEVIGKTPNFLQSGEMSKEAYLDMHELLAMGEEWQGVFHNKKKNDDKYWAKTIILPLRDDDGNISHYIGLGEDVTHQRKAQEQMMRAQKMEAVGLLASGMAHDINNVLTTILGNVHLAQMDAPKKGEFTQELEQIEIAAKRARNLVSQVLNFARRQPGKPNSIKVGDSIKEVVRLLRASIPPNIKIKHKITNDSIMVIADPTRLHQVIMNLCSNAAEAIGADDGEIIIRAKRQTTTDGKKQVSIKIIDNGPGINAKMQKKIFDPFFTTKQAGKGTGLGLSVVANLVTEMNGSIVVSSGSKKGCCFEILLPESEMKPEEMTNNRLLSKRAKIATIMLIDDEPEVVATCAKVLRRNDYHVKAYTDPVLAIRAFQADPKNYALIITDFAMPKMDGEKVCQAIRKLRPNCPIIIYSGYQPINLDLDKLQPIQLLEKPADPKTLAQIVQKLL